MILDLLIVIIKKSKTKSSQINCLRDTGSVLESKLQCEKTNQNVLIRRFNISYAKTF